MSDQSSPTSTFPSKSQANTMPKLARQFGFSSWDEAMSVAIFAAGGEPVADVVVYDELMRLGREAASLHNNEKAHRDLDTERARIEADKLLPMSDKMGVWLVDVASAWDEAPKENIPDHLLDRTEAFMKVVTDAIFGIVIDPDGSERVINQYDAKLLNSRVIRVTSLVGLQVRPAPTENEATPTEETIVTSLASGATASTKEGNDF